MVVMPTKDQLLDCAEHFARTRGFDAFSYADLSKEIGIQKASIHYHFATKADLATALIERYAARFADDLTRISNRRGTAAEDLKAYLGLYKEALSQGSRICLCVSFSAARDSFDDKTLAHLNRFHQDSLAWLARVFDKAGADASIPGLIADPKDEAHSVLSLVEGAQLISRAARSDAPYDHAVQPLLRRLS